MLTIIYFINTSIIDNCTVDNINVNETELGREPEMVGEILENENNEIRFVNNVDNIEYNYIAEDTSIMTENLAVNNQNENRLEPEVVRDILENENNEMRYVNNFDNTQEHYTAEDISIIAENFMVLNPNDNKTEHRLEQEVVRDILENEGNEMRYVNNFDNIEYNYIGENTSIIQHNPNENNTVHDQEPEVFGDLLADVNIFGNIEYKTQERHCIRENTSIVTENFTVDNPNENKTEHGLGPEVVREILENDSNDLRYVNIFDNIEYKTQERHCIREDTSIVTQKFTVDNPSENETEHCQEPEVFGDILANEGNEMRHVNIFEDYEYNKQEGHCMGEEDVPNISDDNPTENETEDRPEPEDLREIFENEINELRYGNISDNIEYNKQEGHCVKEEVPNISNEPISEVIDDKPYKCDVCAKAFSCKPFLVNHIRCHTDEKPYKCDICDKTFSHRTSLVKHKRLHTGEKPFKCVVCDKAFSLKRYLTEHKRIHTGEKPYTCDICEKTFRNSGNLVTHRRRHTGDKPFKCDIICDRTFRNSGNLVAHKYSHTGEKFYKCDSTSGKFVKRKRRHTGDKPSKCDVYDKVFRHRSSLVNHKPLLTGEILFKGDIRDKTFSLRTNTVAHKYTHTGDKPFKCEICNKIFRHRSSLVNHKHLHTGEKLFKCDMCDKVYSFKRYLTEHKRTHTGEKPYKCDLCERTFCQGSSLVAHKRCHTGDKPFKCDTCDRTFSCSVNLVTHKRTHTGEKPYKWDICDKTFSNSDNRRHTGDEPFKCNVCDKIFRTRSSLVHHKSLHTGEKPFKCDMCEKAFRLKINLVEHVRTHTGEKPYKCNICDRTFSQAGSLVAHQRHHTGDKPFKCDICDRTFGCSKTLVTHKYSHTGEKPYKCDICDSTFAQSNSLVKHKRCHTGERPFKCDVCDKSFSLRTTLVSHKRCHTGEKPYKCDMCDKTFNSSSNCLKHKRRHTGEKPIQNISVGCSSVAQNCQKEKGIRTKDTNCDQYELYLQYMETDYAFCNKTINPTQEDEYLETKWKELCNKLNALGDGRNLTVDEWRKRFLDWGHAILTKYRKLDTFTNTGTEPKMTNLEERALSVWEKVVPETPILTDYDGLSFLHEESEGNHLDGDLKFFIEPSTTSTEVNSNKGIAVSKSIKSIAKSPRQKTEEIKIKLQPPKQIQTNTESLDENFMLAMKDFSEEFIEIEKLQNAKYKYENKDFEFDLNYLK